MKHLPTPETLRKLLRYEPETGKLFWRKRKHNLTGIEAGGIDAGHGYRRIKIMPYGLFLAHRIIFAMKNGRWPRRQVDHINGNRSDNRFINLRLVDRSENLKNKTIYKNNKSGCTGVYWHKQHRKWCAQISVNRKNLLLGVFKDKDEAILVRKNAEKQHNFHKNHGRKPNGCI